MQQGWFERLLSAGPIVMGVLNVTPDSFSDGGRFVAPSVALARAQQMVVAGARIIDIGGESSRPGADVVSEQEELDRVLPVIELLRDNLDGAYLSIDTYKPAVMAAACHAGAHMINDIFALTQPGALDVVSELGVPVCLMHMQGRPKTMQMAPQYVTPSQNALYDSPAVVPPVVGQVALFLKERLKACAAAGILPEQICLDPGFGFGKVLADNLHLLQHLNALSIEGRPLLVGVSRKSMIGQLLDRPVAERMAGGLALAMRALEGGARIIRTHDVSETYDVIRIWQALQQNPEDLRDPV